MNFRLILLADKAHVDYMKELNFRTLMNSVKKTLEAPDRCGSQNYDKFNFQDGLLESLNVFIKHPVFYPTINKCISF